MSRPHDEFTCLSKWAKRAPGGKQWDCSGDQGDQGKPGAAWKRCRGTEKSAEDLVGPPERMESEGVARIRPG